MVAPPSTAKILAAVEADMPKSVICGTICNSTVNPVNYGRWTPQLRAARNYEIYVHIPKHHATSTKVRYRILHNRQRHDRIVNQSQYSDQWVSLGTYYFNAANIGREFVLVYDNTREPRASRTIAFDAVKFVPR